jgi:hypothetical protein
MDAPFLQSVYLARLKRIRRGYATERAEIRIGQAHRG